MIHINVIVLQYPFYPLENCYFGPISTRTVVESSLFCNGTADLYESIGFSSDVKGLPGLMKKINGWGDPGSRNRAGWWRYWDVT